MIFLIKSQRISNTRRSTKCGFTLVELLVVLVVFMILVAVSLPIVKGLISDQKTSRTAQSISAFVNAARSRAIGEGRTVGVRFERAGDVNVARSACLRLRQLVGVPSYSGDGADATAVLSGSPINTATFDTADSPLLYLSSEILNDEISPGVFDKSNDHLSPIQVGDMLGLPGGRTVPITSIGKASGSLVSVGFDLSESLPAGVKRFPGSPSSFSVGGKVKYRIQRSPMPSTSNVMSLPKGMGIDLNYSGIGLAGSDFAPSTNPVDEVRSIDILFNADGGVSQVVYSTANERVYPTGLIFFCVGQLDGIASVAGNTAAERENLFSNDRQLTTNIQNPDSLWLVINPASGRVSTVGMASPGTPPSDPTDPTTTEFGTAMESARFFAKLSDSTQ